MFSVEKITSAIFYLLVYYLSTINESLAREEYSIDRPIRDVLSYTLKYTPDFEKKTFTSKCLWILKNNYDSNYFYFYKRNLVVDQQNTHLLKFDKVRSYDNYKVHDDVGSSVSKSKEEPGHINSYYYEGQYPPGEYTLDFTEVSGSLQNSLRGFYFDEYPDENDHSIKFLTTQFGPFGASYAFPSLDEPYFRSKFKITIVRPKEYTCVISNAKLKKSTQTGDFIEDEFEESEKISPSSLAFTVSKLEISEAMEGSIHQIVARPELFKLRNHEYAAILINNIYKGIENFLKINCELKLFYHVALPSNRMKFESLGSYRGINHYKERVLMISNTTSVDIKEKSTIAIAKLVAQQWFLSYLMVDSWTMAWINEGLTMYLAYNITNKLYPNWKIHERLLINTRITMQDDSRCCCIPLNAEARKPSEIESKFNRISVYKGAALITMIERLIPPQVFTKGLRNLIEDKKWSTYTSSDLYQQFEAIMELNNLYEELRLPNKLDEIMNIWESHMGYPVVRVVRNYDTYDLDYVHLSQMRFHFDNSEKNAVWPIPINYATKHYPNFNNTRPTSWITNTNAKLQIKMLKKTDWLILNNQATYYYRVHYDDRNWKTIAEALRENHEDIHYLNRMQLIDDAFSLAEFGMLRYSIAFDISRYFKNEREYAPLKAMKRACKTINKKLADSEPYEKFQSFIKASVEHIYHQVDFMWNADDGTKSKHKNYLTIQLLFSWLCELNSKACDSRHRSNDILEPSLSMFLQKHELCATMRKADKNQWNKLFDKYKKSFNNASVQMNAFYALGCSQDSELQTRFLNYVRKSDKNQLIEAIKLAIAQGVYIGLELALKFVSMLFGDLIKQLTDKDLEDILIDVGSNVVSGSQLDFVTQFLNQHNESRNFIKPCISRAKENIEWRKKNLEGFENNWLNKKSTATKHYYNMHVIFLISYANFILC